MTREYPPEVYGGAGVHVTELVAQLRRLCEVDVHCMGVPRPGAFAHQPDPALADANPALATLSADLRMANAAADATVVHSHTWYTGMAGHIASLLHGVPHVLTAHSLEPLRPWKAEQLGGGYQVSLWVERTAVQAADAVIAVSAGMRDDVLSAYPALDPARVHVVKNGIDTNAWYPAPPDPSESVLSELGVDPAKPMVAFVGRTYRLAAARCPPRADGTFTGTPAAVEGRTTRRRLSGVVMGGAHRRAGRRCRDRGECRHARRRAVGLPGAGPSPGARGQERYRHQRVVPGPTRPERVGAFRTRRRPGQTHGGLRRPHHPPEGCAAPHCGSSSL